MSSTWSGVVVSGLISVSICFATAATGTAADLQPMVTPELEAMGFDVDPAREHETAIPPQPKTRAIVDAVLVIQEGQIPPGAVTPVSSLSTPFTNGTGEVGFTGSIGENFVWFGNGITWLNSDGLPDTLTGGESTMGISDTGGFVYSPSVNGNDSVWTHNGLLQTENVAAPGYAPPTTVTFNSRPQMLPGGAAYWVSGLSYTGGTSSEGRVLYTSSDSIPASIVPVLASDDLVGGVPIVRPSGIDFDYQISDNALHHIHVLLLDVASTTWDGIVYVDGLSVAAEASPSGAGDNWDNFDTVSINNTGDYLFSGDTDGASTTDEFIAYNGVIAIREGDTIGGVTLTSSASVRTVSINNLGHAAHIWSNNAGEDLFFACNAADLAAGSTLVLAVLDEVDLDSNGTGDATVIDFNASNIIGPGLWLAEDGKIFVEVDLRYGATDLEAIIRLDLPFCGLFADGFESGTTGAWS